MIVLQQIIEEQFRLYKKIQVQDIYKLFYQATFGCEHAVNEESREILYEEFYKAELSNKEHIIERISPYFFICRVNIRPYKSCGGNKEELFEWFYKSSKRKKGRIQDFLTLWTMFKRMNEEKKYIPIKKVKSFEKKWKGKDLPVLHHSNQYKRINMPSYRIVR